MAKKWYLRYRVHIIVALVLGCFYGVRISNIYGFSIFPDEFTYWSYAAHISGYDWSNIVSLGSYYSYGYSIILLPVFLLCKEAGIAYRVAVGINFLFLFLAFVCLVRVIRKLFPDKNIPVEVFSVLAILFPGNLFYAQMTMTEILLVFIYILTGWLLLDYLNHNRKHTLCMLIMLLMYSYMVHMRTIGILLSTVGVLLFHMLSKKGKRQHIWMLAGILFLAFVIEHILKNRAIHNVYGNIEPGLIRGNDYEGQLDKIRYIFTIEGIYDAAISVWGKILYLGLATCGLFYWGAVSIVREVKEIVRRVKKRIEITVKQKFSLFILLSATAQILIATVYLLTLGEISDYTYGRYVELIIPFLTVYGAVELWQRKAGGIIAVTGIMAVIQFIGITLVVSQILKTGAETFHGFFMVGISYLYDEKNFNVIDFYRAAYLFCEAMTVLMVMIIFFCRNSKKRYYFLMTVVVAELVLSMKASRLFLSPLQKAAFRDGRMAEKIEAMQGEGYQVVYVDDAFPVYVGILQFGARGMDIQIIEEHNIAENYVTIFAFDSGNISKWARSFSHAYTYGHFTLLYND